MLIVKITEYKWVNCTTHISYLYFIYLYICSFPIQGEQLQLLLDSGRRSTSRCHTRSRSLRVVYWAPASGCRPENAIKEELSETVKYILLVLSPDSIIVHEWCSHPALLYSLSDFPPSLTTLFFHRLPYLNIPLHILLQSRLSSSLHRANNTYMGTWVECYLNFTNIFLYLRNTRMKLPYTYVNCIHLYI